MCIHEGVFVFVCVRVCVCGVGVCICVCIGKFGGQTQMIGVFLNHFDLSF